MERNVLLGILVAVVLVGGVGIAVATTGSPAGTPDPEISEQQAVEIAETHVNGTAQAVELETEDEGPVYEVTVERADGRLVEVEVDGTTGDVLEVEPEDDEGEAEDDDDESGDDEEDDD